MLHSLGRLMQSTNLVYASVNELNMLWHMLIRRGALLTNMLNPKQYLCMMMFTRYVFLHKTLLQSGKLITIDRHLGTPTTTLIEKETEVYTQNTILLTVF